MKVIVEVRKEVEQISRLLLILQGWCLESAKEKRPQTVEITFSFPDSLHGMSSMEARRAIVDRCDRSGLVVAVREG